VVATAHGIMKRWGFFFTPMRLKVGDGTSLLTTQFKAAGVRDLYGSWLLGRGGSESPSGSMFYHSPNAGEREGHVKLLAKRLGALQLAEASARRGGDAEGVSTGKWRGWPPRLGERYDAFFYCYIQGLRCNSHRLLLTTGLEAACNMDCVAAGFWAGRKRWVTSCSITRASPAATENAPPAACR
jgi:hypothetical protein